MKIARLSIPLLLFTALLDIRSVNAQYAERVLISSSTYVHGRPQWSPKEDRIAFYRWPAGADEPTDLLVMRADGTGTAEVLVSFKLAQGTPQWSPDGQWILYMPFGEIYKVNVATKERVRITGGFEPQYARWSPDGSRILYLLYGIVGAYKQLWIAPSAGGSDGTKILERYEVVDPRWSPDGTRIYFLSGGPLDEDGTVGRRREIAWIPATGGAVQTVAKLPDGWAVNSREGLEVPSTGFPMILEAIPGTPPSQVASITAAGKVTQLTSEVSSIGEPRISPDGAKVVFLGQGTSPGEAVLRLLRLSAGGESGTVVDLVPGIPSSFGQMAWSSDSRRIVYFRRTSDGKPALVIVDLGATLTSIEPTVGSSNQPTAVTLRGENIQGPDRELAVWAIRDPLGPATEGQLLDHPDTRSVRVLFPTDRMGPGVFRVLLVNPTGVWAEIRGFVVQGVPVPTLSLVGTLVGLLMMGTAGLATARRRGALGASFEALGS
jgi:Tol biopolymer transport system component